MLSIKKKVCLATVLAMLISAFSVFAEGAVQRFWDVPSNHWAFEYIADLAERKVINGYDDGSFQPNRTVSRAEWAKMMVDAAGVSANDTSISFVDMPSNHWATPFVNAAKKYMTGYKDGTFRPDQAATREDVTVAMVLLKGYDVSDVDYSYLTFSDNDTISNYAKAYVAVAVKYNLISGFSDGTFRGQDTLSRAQAATLLYRAFQHGNADKVIGGVSIPSPSPSAAPAITKDEEYNQQAKPSTQPISNSSDTEDSQQSSVASYTLDTLVEAKHVKNAYQYTTDNRGNIYFLDGDYIDYVNIDTRVVSHYQYIPDLDFTGDGISFGQFSVYSLCWDISDNTLIIQGSYDNVKCADPDQIVNRFIIKSPGMEGTLDLVNATFQDENNMMWADSGTTHIVATTSGGCLITNYQLLNEEGTELIDSIVPESDHWVTAHTYTRYAAHIGSNIYYITANDSGEDLHSLCSYNFSNVSTLFDFRAVAYCMHSSSLFIMKDNALERWDLSGKLTGGVLFSDITVKDSRPLKSASVLEKLVVSGPHVVFYDTAAKSFRVVTVR